MPLRQLSHQFNGLLSSTHHFRQWVTFGVNIDCLEICLAKVVIVEGFREIIAVTDEEPAVVDLDGLAKFKILWCEVFLDFLSSKLHDHGGEGGFNVITVLWDLVSCNENREGVASIVGGVHFTDLQGVIHQVVL